MYGKKDVGGKRTINVGGKLGDLCEMISTHSTRAEKEGKNIGVRNGSYNVRNGP